MKKVLKILSNLIFFRNEIVGANEIIFGLLNLPLCANSNFVKTNIRSRHIVKIKSFFWFRELLKKPKPLNHALLGKAIIVSALDLMLTF